MTETWFRNKELHTDLISPASFFSSSRVKNSSVPSTMSWRQIHKPLEKEWIWSANELNTKTITAADIYSSFIWGRPYTWRYSPLTPDAACLSSSQSSSLHQFYPEIKDFVNDSGQNCYIFPRLTSETIRAWFPQNQQWKTFIPIS